MLLRFTADLLPDDRVGDLAWDFGKPLPGPPINWMWPTPLHGAHPICWRCQTRTHRSGEPCA